MIIVTGTKRSGTSMWMQALVAAGLPWIGQEFLGHWEQSIRDANPRGFFESPLRKGVFFATNPDPKTGTFIFPKQSRRHVVKVFIPGLVRTDYAYIDRVVATMRPWRAYCASIERLYRIEDEFLAGLPVEEGETRTPLEKARGERPKLPSAIEWWFENYELIRDIATRRYPVNLVSYHRLLEDPEVAMAKVIDWVGGGDLSAALAAISPELRTQAAEVEVDQPVEPETAALFDELHDAIYQKQSLPGTLLTRLNEEQERLEERWRPVPLRDRQ